MIEALIITLIYIAVLALVVWLVVWVLTSLVGLALPDKVVQIIWVIFVLVAILLLVRVLIGGGTGIKIGGQSKLPLEASTEVVWRG